ITFSKSFQEILNVVPPQWLVFIQSFRIVVEILLVAAFSKGLLPVQMTFEGRNFDIITGILALPVGYFCFVRKSWPQSVAVLYNVLGIGLLINVLVIALLSMPASWRYFMNEPSTAIVGEFPFIYLPGMLVVIGYSMHLFSLRQLFSVRK